MQRAKQRLTVAVAFLAWLAGRRRQLSECTQHDLDEWFAAGPTTRRHVITCLSWAWQQRIICGVDVPATSTEGAEACLPGPDAWRAAIRRLLIDDTLPPGDRFAVAVSRPGRLRGSQLPSARPGSSPAWHPCPGEPAGRLARPGP